MRIGNHVIRFFYILMGIIFFPVLLCVIFIGNHMNYNESLKLAVRVPNYVLFVIVLLGIAVICLLVEVTEKLWQKSKTSRIENNRIRLDLVFDIVLAAVFILLFFVNVRIAKEIAFLLPWDVGVVRAEALRITEGIPAGYSVYLSMYSNNVPMVYILKELYNKAAELGHYPYVYEFLWLQVNCGLISIGGFFGCLAVKKLTGKFLPALFSLLLYLALPGISPWKIAPYTDTYGIAFPIMCIYFCICYKDAKSAVGKYLFIILALASGTAGGLIKPSAYIVVIAVLGAECIGCVMNCRRNWKYLLAEAVLAAVLFFAKNAYVDYMMEDIGLDFNPEIEASWQNYFYMGLNEETTGSYHPGDAGIFGEFQTDKRARNEAALERAFERIKERGAFGTLYYWLRKMTMVFNDGTFGWRGEVWSNGDYPEDLAGNDGFTDALRDTLWPGGSHMGRYNTFAQLAWIFCIVGIFGICFCPGEKRERYAVAVVSFLGIFFYQMLFEARARYLLVFFPVLGALSICGIWQYVYWVRRLLRRRRLMPQKNRDEKGLGAGVAEEAGTKNL